MFLFNVFTLNCHDVIVIVRCFSFKFFLSECLCLSVCFSICLSRSFIICKLLRSYGYFVLVFNILIRGSFQT